MLDQISVQHVVNLLKHQSTFFVLVLRIVGSDLGFSDHPRFRLILFCITVLLLKFSISVLCQGGFTGVSSLVGHPVRAGSPFRFWLSWFCALLLL